MHEGPRPGRYSPPRRHVARPAGPRRAGRKLLADTATSSAGATSTKGAASAIVTANSNGNTASVSACARPVSTPRHHAPPVCVPALACCLPPPNCLPPPHTRTPPCQMARALLAPTPGAPLPPAPTPPPTPTATAPRCVRVLPSLRLASRRYRPPPPPPPSQCARAHGACAHPPPPTFACAQETTLDVAANNAASASTARSTSNNAGTNQSERWGLPACLPPRATTCTPPMRCDPHHVAPHSCHSPSLPPSPVDSGSVSLAGPGGATFGTAATSGNGDGVIGRTGALTVAGNGGASEGCWGCPAPRLLAQLAAPLPACPLTPRPLARHGRLDDCGHQRGRALLLRVCCCWQRPGHNLWEHHQ